MGFLFFSAKKKPGTVINAVTGVEVTVNMRGFCPIIDTHMHIQSNNCCPLTIQWAVMATNIYDKSMGILGGSREIASRRQVADSGKSFLGELFAGRFSGVGVLSTEIISKTIMGIAKDKDMPEDLYWVAYDSPEEYKKAGAEVAGRAAKIGSVDKGNIDSLNEHFYTDAEYYYHNKDPFHMFVALPMDLSFAHYWGSTGLPVYIALQEDLFYVNDFVCLHAINSSSGTQVTLFNDVLIPQEYKDLEVGVFDPDKIQKDVADVIHLFAKRLPGDVWSEFKWNDPPKVKGHTIIIFDGDQKLAGECSRKEFVHLVSTAPDKDNKKYEEYWKQLWFHQASAIRFPFQQIGFFHYDPRRFVNNESEIEKKAVDILKSHGFFTFTMDTKRNALALTAHKELNTHDFMTDLLNKEIRTNEFVFNELFLYPESKNGIFWGIKMYPKLGYAPDDFLNYKHLEYFYSICANYSIPITTHTSPGGMEIADPYCFERYVGGTAKKEYHHKDAHQFIIDRYHNLSCWENVLDRYKKLKINFAHFGGNDLWKEIKKAKELYGKGRVSAKKTEEKQFFDWICKIAELSQNHDNVYTDLSYFITPDPFLFQQQREHTAETLVFLLEKYPALKDRILMGSDWYMIEIEKEKGVGAYYSKMFKLLKMVSEKTGYDAWHQFAVINPLRFLGLIDEKKGGEGPFQVDVKKVEGYLSRMKWYLNNTDWKSIGNFSEAFGKIDDKCNLIIKLFNRNKTIKDSKKILREKDLLILSQK
jgi:hypothetical protein